MAKCNNLIYSKKNGIWFPCGKCLHCRKRRISGWTFRLEKEAERSESALFVTLTYDTGYVPITKNGFMTLEKTDIQKFIKRLRKNAKNKTNIKYYCAGEYGGKTSRPHYHIILYNSSLKDVEKAWCAVSPETGEYGPIGSVHVGTLTAASAAYTAKYIMKGNYRKKHERDDRIPEFSLMSKRLGDNYITKKIKKWHKKDMVNRYYLPLKDGVKIALPRYYKEKIFTKLERNLIGLAHNQRIMEEEENVEKTSLEFWEEAQNIEYEERVKNRDARNNKI